MRNASPIRLLLVLAMLLAGMGAHAQQENATHEPTKGLAFGAHAHSYGFGFSIRAIKVQGKGLASLDIAISSLKHPRELSIESAYIDQGGKDYIFDKKNYAYTLAPTLAITRPIIAKTGYNRISISATAAAGPLLTLLKPYWVEVAVPLTGNTAYTDEFPFDATKHNFSNIYGEADYFLGMSDISAIPGLRAKLGAAVDFSASKEYIRAIEFNAFADLYGKAPEILDATPNPRYYIGGSVGVVVGNMW